MSALRDGTSMDSKWVSVMVLAGAALLLSPTLDYRMTTDHGFYAYIATEFLKGNWPYVATWDSNFPGMMFLQTAIQLVFGRSVVMFRVFDLVVQLGLVYMVFWGVVRLANIAGGVLAVGLYCLTYQGYGPWNTAQREGFAMVFVMVGWWLYLTRERRSPTVTAALIGLGLGLAAIFKPTMLALVLLYAPLLWRPRPGWVRLALAGAAATLIPAILIVAVYWIIGGVTDLYEATIAYQQIYTRHFRGDTGLVSATFANLWKIGLNAKAMLLGVPLFLWWGTHRRDRTMLYTGYVGTVIAVAAQGTFAGYHYLPGLALGVVLVGCIYAQVTGRIPILTRPLGFGRMNPSLLMAMLLVALMVPRFVNADAVRDVATLHFLEPPRPDEYRNQDIFDYYEDWQLAQYLTARTDPQDKIQIWGFESLVYHLADRSAASRFQATQPLIMRVLGRPLGPMQHRWRDEFVNAIRRENPVYVAVVRGDRWWWSPEGQTSEELLGDFPEWQEIIQSEYTLETEIGRFAVYRLTAQP